MSALLRSAHLFDAIALLIALEWAALAAWRRRTGRGPSIGSATSFLGAGALLFVALRTIAADGPSGVAAGALLGALGCHLWHLARLWRR